MDPPCEPPQTSLRYPPERFWNRPKKVCVIRPNVFRAARKKNSRFPKKKFEISSNSPRGLQRRSQQQRTPSVQRSSLDRLAIACPARTARPSIAWRSRVEHVLPDPRSLGDRQSSTYCPTIDRLAIATRAPLAGATNHRRRNVEKASRERRKGREGGTWWVGSRTPHPFVG